MALVKGDMVAFIPGRVGRTGSVMKGIRIVKLGHSVGDDIVLTADSHWAEWVFISSEQNGGDG